MAQANSPVPLPPEPETLRIPVGSAAPSAPVQLSVEGGLVTVVASGASLNEVVSLLARQEGLNVVAAEDMNSRVNITLDKVPLQDALDSILAVAGYTAVRQNNIVMITSTGTSQKASPQTQGRTVRVFHLNYTSAMEVNTVVQGLLSPSGQSFMLQTKENDNRKTQDMLVVEDMPWNMERIARTVQELDVAPRQVLIEAHILSVELTKDMKHGVNLEYLNHISPEVTLRTDGFANAAAFADPNSSQAFFFNLAATDLNILLEALETNMNAKTLASPKVFALNGQQARIQVGGQVGYKVVTTTQTMSAESVEFLNWGTILTVTPQITPDNKVMIKVRPQVSTATVNETTKVPDSTTRELETSVILPDGYGIVIGGLIQEEDIQQQQKVPIAGDLWIIGRLFQRRQITRKRNELIISLVPHILPYGPECQQRESEQFVRSATPLLCGPLKEYPRPWEPELRDAGQPPACIKRRHDDRRGVPPPPASPHFIPPAYGDYLPARPETPFQEEPEVLPTPPDPAPLPP